MYNYKNKMGNIKLLNDYMLTRTLSMFEYSNLPATLPSTEIEKQLQKNGFTFITMVDNQLYAFTGGLGGEPNAYNEPTQITINNPALNFSRTLDINDDGVLIKNDDLQLGLIDLYSKYNTLLIENEITMFLNSYNTRIRSLISAGDDNTKESAEVFLKKVIDGELGIIGENRLFEGIKVQNSQSNTSNITTQLIEFNQYIKATLFNEVGLNANFNMKRERLNSGEVDMNSDNLHPLVDNMLENRVKGFNRVNEMFDTDIGVQFGSIWAIRNKSDIIEDDEPLVKDVEPIEEDDEPLVQDVEPLVQDVEPIEEHEEPLLEDSEPIEEHEEPYNALEEMKDNEEDNKGVG